MPFQDLADAHPVVQAVLATLFTWAVTAAGAALVFVFRSMRPRILGAMNGFAAGVMIAASFWSLLAPAIDLSEKLGWPAWFPAAAGFLAGGAFLYAADKVIPHLHPIPSGLAAEGPATRLRKSSLVVLAITLHNIPEGLAIGVAFGAAAAGLPDATLAGALALTLGIALQNFPEGAAVAFPLRADGLPAGRSFWYGQLSAAVEPVAAALGAAAVLIARPILPFALAFAAGAMIFVVVEELVPAAQSEGNTDLATAATMIGFTVMMGLDVGLG